MTSHGKRKVFVGLCFCLAQIESFSVIICFAVKLCFASSWLSTRSVLSHYNLAQTTPGVVSLTKLQRLLSSNDLGTEAKVKILRSKLILVGEGRAGKTSTCKSLLWQPFDRNERSTVACSSKDVRLNIQHSVVWEGINDKPDLYRALLAASMQREDLGAASESGGPIDTNAAAAASEHLLNNNPEPALPDRAREKEETPKLMSTSGESMTSNEESISLRHVLDKARLHVEQNDQSDVHDHILYSVWDFAGQSVFHDILPVLMTK